MFIKSGVACMCVNKSGVLIKSCVFIKSGVACRYVC